MGHLEITSNGKDGLTWTRLATGHERLEVVASLTDVPTRRLGYRDRLESLVKDAVCGKERWLIE